MKRNKEIIDSLVSYFIEQDKAILCRVLANMMIDINRIENIDQLPIDEKDRLLIRIRKNSQSLQKFIKQGANGPLTCGELYE